MVLEPVAGHVGVGIGGRRLALVCNCAVLPEAPRSERLLSRAGPYGNEVVDGQFSDAQAAFGSGIIVSNGSRSGGIFPGTQGILPDNGDRRLDSFWSAGFHDSYRTSTQLGVHSGGILGVNDPY